MLASGCNDKNESSVFLYQKLRTLRKLCPTVLMSTKNEHWHRVILVENLPRKKKNNWKALKFSKYRELGKTYL